MQRFRNRRKISRQAKVTVFRIIYTPILTYASKTWVTNKITQRRQAIGNCGRISTSNKIKFQHPLG